MNTKEYIGVQFSGNATVYPYEVPNNRTTVYGEPAAVGMRVVVPTKMKSDGTVTLTIGIIVAVEADELAKLVAAGPVKPIIQVLDAQEIAQATAVVAAIEIAAKAVTA